MSDWYNLDGGEEPRTVEQGEARIQAVRVEAAQAAHREKLWGGPEIGFSESSSLLDLADRAEAALRAQLHGTLLKRHPELARHIGRPSTPVRAQTVDQAIADMVKGGSDAVSR